MATCKDCIHYGICSLWSTKDLEEDEAYKYCFGNFKSAADVVEVVRCKDCKHCERGICYYPKVRYVSHDKNHFCSYGERK